jgi:hypothetical protein
MTREKQILRFAEAEKLLFSANNLICRELGKKKFETVPA